MKSTTTSSRWLSIVAGLAASGGALAILCSDALRTGHWTLEHALMPLVVGIAIASGFLIESAVRERRILSALGFVAVFALATAATIYNSVGRQAAQANMASNQVKFSNEKIDQTRADLIHAKQRFADAEIMVSRETKRGGCGRNCKDWKTRAAEVRSHIQVLESKLEGLGPKQVESPKADRAAKVASLLGYERERTKEVLHLIEPFLYALLFELAAIVAFGFGFAYRKPLAAKKIPETRPANPGPGKGKRGRKRDPQILDFVASHKKRNGGSPPDAVLIQERFPGIGRSTAYEYRQVG